jgi:hypothetical protein
MEIGGNHLVFPRNFLFLNRLPARFEILVIGKGAITPQGTAYELEVAGQRIVLKSQIELRPGKKYQLEKVSVREFRISKELDEKPVESARTSSFEQQVRDDTNQDALALLMPETSLDFLNLLALKVLNDARRSVTTDAGKFRFDFGGELGAKGVFIPGKPGEFTLFVAGSGVNSTDITEIEKLLADLGVTRIRHVTEQVLERIAHGAIDLQS